jgi:acetyl-CoA synthetase
MNPDRSDPSSAAWTPTPEFIRSTNMAWLMQQAGVNSYDALHAWSVQHREAFWKIAIEGLGIRFQHAFSSIVDTSCEIENPRWLVDAQYNIVDSCFTAATNSPAIVYQKENGPLTTVTVGELESLTSIIAASLKRRGFTIGDAIALVMPMTVEAVAIYLGIIKAGCIAVSIADSFQPKELATRLTLANAVAVFTQDHTIRGSKTLPLYSNLTEAGAPRTIVLPASNTVTLALRTGDISWSEFLGENAASDSVIRAPSDPINILFSSGTTGEPKAIPWNHTTPIKCAVDAHFHQDVRPGDVLVWPTNMGWMMGPWLVFAALLNRATIGLFCGAPTGREFGSFVQDSKATMLGVVPSLVKTWRHSDCMLGLDWNRIRVLSSTGECSSADDMRWLIAQAGGQAPVIEYCGGTEIGGGYITGTVTKPCIPATFNTPALGLDLVILNDVGKRADCGEVYIIPPSIGLSTTLLNKDHHDVYYDGTPLGPNGELLRRHGDQMEQLPNGYWRAQGRADDTMNLGGIKVSSAEIEKVVLSVPGVVESAAVAVSPDGGPSLLVIYVVSSTRGSRSKPELQDAMQRAIKRDLNPLFKIHDVVEIDALPRTASNKVLRRELRALEVRRVAALPASV